MLNTPDTNTVHAIIKTLGRGIWSSSETPAGLLLTLTSNITPDVTTALQTAGYTATQVCANTVMVGGVDPVTLLDAQITALTAQRDALTQDRQVRAMEDVMGGPF